MDLADHVDALLQHVPSLRIDVVLAHAPEPALAHAHAVAVGPTPLPLDEQRIRACGADVLRAVLGDARDGHDPDLLAEVLRTRLLPDPPAAG